MKKVSIIIPVYNVERYLSVCLDSIINQTYKNLQIIIVDDESQDNCPMICDEYMKKDNRVQVIHQKNRGAAGARNSGLDIACGEYICFVDSDDVVDSKYVERLVYYIEKDNADMAVCSFKNVYTDRSVSGGKPENAIYSVEDYLLRFLDDWTCGLIWNKIFKAHILANVRFAEGHKIDDEFFTYKGVINCNKVTVFAEELYFYRMRKSGVMSSSSEYKEKIIQDRLEYLTERFEIVTKRYPSLKSKYLTNLTDNLIYLLRESFSYPKTHTIVKTVIKRYRKKIILGNIPLKMKYSFMMRNNNTQLSDNKIEDVNNMFL